MNFIKIIIILTAQSVWATQKFCINCKHFLPSKLDSLTSATKEDYATCALFSINNLNIVSLVTGISEPNYDSESIDYIYDYASDYCCYTARHFEEMCGKSGKRYVENTQSDIVLPPPVSKKVIISESSMPKDDSINNFILSFLKKLICFLEDHS
jgi:hypothetical protein